MTCACAPHLAGTLPPAVAQLKRTEAARRRAANRLGKAP